MPRHEVLFTENTISAGADKPFRVLHVGDTHFALSDRRDDERKQQLGSVRRKDFAKFPDSTEIYWQQIIEYGRNECDLIIHTGDLIDFVSVPNLEKFAEIQQEPKLFTVSGNHEFSLYVGEAFEDTAYKMQSFGKLQSLAANDLDFACRIVNGVNFVAIDDSYYLFTERHLELLKNELAKKYPVILCLHNPLYTPDTGEELIRTSAAHCSYMVDAPAEKLALYDDYRRRQQTPDEPTCRFVEFCRHAPGIKAIFAGHLHRYFKSCFNGIIPQFVCGAGYAGEANIYNIN